jgi:hypothetical protein
MTRNRSTRPIVLASIIGTTLLLAQSPALAHCDGMDGPVVKAAQRALEAGDVNLVLIWVQQKDEAEIRNAFEQALAVRKLSPEAKQVADTWFFETLVRIHRAGEGAPYTGLKPAGRDLGPAIPAADEAIETGSVDDVLKLLTDTSQKGVRDRFTQLMAKKAFKKDDVDAGREYVKAYVVLVHYVEGLYQAASTSPHGHLRDAEEHATHDDQQAQEHWHDATAKGEPSMKVQIPQPLKAEHDELHADLVKATKAGGKVGEAAIAVARVLHPHFVKEEEYALPPLGLLQVVSRGEVSPEMRAVVTMTDKLQAELPQMLTEHKAIVTALEALKAAALAEHNHEVAHFAEKLVVHARTEEEVMYPAALLVGEYLKIKLPK